MLAERAGISPQAIKRMEQGIGSVQTLVAVMKALDFRLTGLGPGKTMGEQLRARRHARACLAHLATETCIPVTGDYARVRRLFAILVTSIGSFRKAGSVFGFKAWLWLI